MKTPMEELIEELQSYNNTQMDLLASGITMRYLTKEKQMIIDAVVQCKMKRFPFATETAILRFNEHGEQYYNETFKTEES